MLRPATIHAFVLLFISTVAVHGTHASAEQPPRVPILFDTDIGNDIDDVFALALVLTSPELDVRGITTVGSGPQTRALMVCRILNAVGRHDIPVVAGSLPQPGAPLKDQARYLDTPADPVVPEKSKPVPDLDAVEFLYRRFKQEPGKLTLVAVGPLTNVARLISEHPDCKAWIPRIAIMGGAVHVDYNGQPKSEVEWNLKTDVAAARTVFSAGIPLLVAPLDATYNVALESAERKRIFDVNGPLQRQIQTIYRFWNKPTPILFDPVAIALAFDEHFCELKDLRLDVDKQGRTVVVEGKPNARVAVSIQREEFIRWFTERLTKAPSVPSPAGAPSDPK
jgi:purine nucleosidase